MPGADLPCHERAVKKSRLLAIVVGRPASVGPEQEAVAYVVPAGDLAHHELAQYCVNHLPREKFPGRIFYTAAIPRTPAGKIDRVAVRNFAVDPVNGRS